ncbi:MAG: hypothetical protein K9M03_01020 [Kiritimatiellales bacterium]|nr:hypothetical protein [Kiritimatiellales bacterium]
MDEELLTIAGISNIASLLKVSIDCYDEDDPDAIAVLRECRDLSDATREQLVGLLTAHRKIPNRLETLSTDTLRICVAICNVAASNNATYTKGTEHCTPNQCRGTDHAISNDDESTW